jgi:hypothetical protein
MASVNSYTHSTCVHIERMKSGEVTEVIVTGSLSRTVGHIRYTQHWIMYHILSN